MTVIAREIASSSATFGGETPRDDEKGYCDTVSMTKNDNCDTV